MNHIGDKLHVRVKISTTMQGVGSISSSGPTIAVDKEKLHGAHVDNHVVAAESNIVPPVHLSDATGSSGTRWNSTTSFVKGKKSLKRVA